MALKDIISISGQSGLYKFVAQAKNGVIVESLITKKRIQAYASDKVSALEDIAIYTNAKEVPLAEVMKNIVKKENSGPAIDPKTSSSDALKKYMEEILPEYDKQRVYVSDIKKLLTWYNTLQAAGMLDFENDTKEATAETKDKTVAS